jgi:hypothetical protein
LQDIGLAEYKEQSKMQAATEEYGTSRAAVPVARLRGKPAAEAE